MILTTRQIINDIANGLLVYGACNIEKRCWEKEEGICRICFETGWYELFQEAAQDDHDESEFKMTTHIELVLRSFANQQIILPKIQPNLDQQQFIDHYKHKLVAAYEAKLRNEFSCNLAGKPILNDW